MCDVCGKIFASAQYMMTHKKMHETGAFLCNECGKEFDTKIKLNRYFLQSAFQYGCTWFCRHLIG